MIDGIYSFTGGEQTPAPAPAPAKLVKTPAPAPALRLRCTALDFDKCIETLMDAED